MLDHVPCDRAFGCWTVELIDSAADGLRRTALAELGVEDASPRLLHGHIPHHELMEVERSFAYVGHGCEFVLAR